MPRPEKLLASVGHAASGAGGTIVSTLATYPLDLVNTRLKVQRQLRADGKIREEDGYAGVFDAFASIYEKEGGIQAFFAGLGADLGKSAADSFLFFLFYTWFRARRLVGRNGLPHLRVIEELAVGAAAGACAKLFTTPVSNVVTRRQTANLMDSHTTAANGNGNGQPKAKDLSFRGILSEIRRERGLLGLWAGYSASLVLTLNPSMTFFLQQILKRLLVPREKWDDPGAQMTFILAAMSKVAATSVTYPFQIAKARIQVAAKHEEKDAGPGKSSSRKLPRETIFSIVPRIAREEGVKALYDGMAGELLKGFFNHGTTMLTKDIIHGFIINLYFAVLAALKNYPQIRARLAERMGRARQEMRTRSILLGWNGYQRGLHYVRTIGSLVNK